MPTKALSCKKEAICEHGPEAPSCPVGQGSFKMDRFKVFYSQTSPFSTFLLEIMEAVSSGLNEWMMHLYSALLCIVVHPKHFTIMWGGLSSTTTSVHYPLWWCDGCHRTTAPVRSPLTSYRWREERVIEPIKWMWIIRRPWLTRASGGNLARTPGYIPTPYLHPYEYIPTSTSLLFTRSAMGFLMTTECQDLSLMSHPKDGAFYSIVSPSLSRGVRTHTDHRVSTHCWSN